MHWALSTAVRTCTTLYVGHKDGFVNAGLMTCRSLPHSVLRITQKLSSVERNKWWASDP